MPFSTLDAVVFFAFVISVVGIGLVKGRRGGEGGSESYFLAGRGLSWWLIGFSLIAANISTEQFVGMAGQAAGSVGLAVASYEWLSAVALVFVAFCFLPKFLRAGVYTIPEFLEQRFDAKARALMAGSMMVVYVGVVIAAVIYSGALVFTSVQPEVSVEGWAWIIGGLAAAYVVTGGLKACAWADLVQGAALLVGGFSILWLAIEALAAAPVAELATTTTVEGLSDAAGGWEKFFALNADRLHVALSAEDEGLPWTALLLGIWVPVTYYWGLNQYIVQRTLGAHSLADGQRGVVFAAAIKLLLPFAIVFPGMIAFNLYSDGMADAGHAELIEAFESGTGEIDGGSGGGAFVFEYDAGWAADYPDDAARIDDWNASVTAWAAAAEAEPAVKSFPRYHHDGALGLLLTRLVPDGHGLKGFILAALLGAVVSSLASMLNAASTIFTMDLFRRYVRPGASQQQLVRTGRVCVLVFMAIGCLIAPFLGDPRFKGVFNYIQEFQGFISPGILALFLFGLFVPRAPAVCGVVAMVASPVAYGALLWIVPELAFLNRMAFVFLGVVAVLGCITRVAPRATPFLLESEPEIEMRSCRTSRNVGLVLIGVTVGLYVWFW